MTEYEYSIELALKYSQWEKTKGEMRAWAKLMGAGYSGYDKNGNPGPEKVTYDRVDQLVEDFIKEVEEDGLCE